MRCIIRLVVKYIFIIDLFGKTNNNLPFVLKPAKLKNI